MERRTYDMDPPWNMSNGSRLRPGGVLYASRWPSNPQPFSYSKQITRGATDQNKTHGSDRVTVFESRVGSFSDQQQQKR